MLYLSVDCSKFSFTIKLFYALLRRQSAEKVFIAFLTTMECFKHGH